MDGEPDLRGERDCLAKIQRLVMVEFMHIIIKP